MKLNVNINSGKSFQGLRQDRKFVQQLAKEQAFSLSENNQKNIIKSIKNIGEHGSVSGTKFLLDVAQNIKFATNIKFNFNPKNKWMAMLLLAASGSAAKAGISNKKDIEKEFQSIFLADKELNDTEKDILVSYKNINSRVASLNPKQEDAKIAQENLEYFIISSETSLEDKKYILERLDYFLSDDYKINPELTDYKFQAYSEIINDLALDKVSKNEPNIKAQNQRQFGICTSISIGRKLLAYEYKRNFVDTILSELDESPEMMIYDRKQLGTGKKISVPKIDIDYTQAIKTGYRIIDISVTNWMNYSDIEGNTSNVQKTYIAFDMPNYNSYKDSHIKILSPETGVANEHEYYQALSVTSKRLEVLRNTVKREKEKSTTKQDALLLAKERGLFIDNLRTDISNLLIDNHKEQSGDIVSKLLKLKHKNSDSIDSEKYISKDYLYIDNEEEAVKKSKIKRFLEDGFSYALSSELTEEQINNIYELTETIHAIKVPKKASQFSIAKLAVEAAEAFRHHILKASNVHSRMQSYLIGFEAGEEDARFLKAINKLIEKVENNNEVIITKLCERNNVEPSKENALELLSVFKEYIENLPGLYDNLFQRMNLGNKNSVLLNELKANKELLKSGDTEKIYKAMMATGIYDEKEYQERVDRAIEILTHSEMISNYAEMFQVENNKDKVFKTLRAVIGGITINNDEALEQDIANALEITPEEVIPLLMQDASILNGDHDDYFYNEAAKEVHQFSIKNDFMSYYNVLVNTFASGIDKEFVDELLVNNGEEPGFTPEKIQNVMTNLINDINNMGININTIAENLLIETDNGDVINSIYPAHIVLSEFEKSGFILKPSEMKLFQDKFDALTKLDSEKSKYSKEEYRRKVKELKTLTRQEKDLVNLILSNMNMMASNVEREQKFLIKDLKPKFEDAYRDYGVNSGRYWVGLTPSSGAAGNQEVAMLESITGKPYYIETNLQRGFNKIKNGMHSGISTTSVSDSSAGWHAQYVASIDTVKVPSKNNPNVMIEKDVLFHDNTWGNAESENTWMDSRGYKRTDYQGDYGYKYGYMTDDKLRNGTFVDDLLTKKGKIKDLEPNAKPWVEGYSFDLMPDLILQGNTTKALDIAKQIKDTLFTSNDSALEALEDAVKNMSTEELRHRLDVLNNIKLNYHAVFDDYIKTIKGDNVNSGIKTEEEYNAIPANSSLKLALEKAALRKTFSQANYIEAIEKASTLEELSEAKTILLDDLRDMFVYAFNKDLSLVNFFTLDIDDNHFITQQISEVIGRKPSESELKEIINPENLEKEMDEMGFDGSLRSFANNLANCITDNIIKKFNEQISLETSLELRDKLSKYIVKEISIKQQNLDNKEIPLFVEKIIDKIYNPESDEEFIEIYRRIQGYTYEKFEQKILNNLTDEMLLSLTPNLKGYDLVKAIRAEKESAEDALFLELYLDEINKVYERDVIKPVIRYNKFSNRYTAQIYETRMFDSSYIELRYALSHLNYKKMFDKVKQQVLEKYNMLPAYPHLKAMEDGDEMVETSLELIKKTSRRVAFLNQQLNVFETVKNIENYFYNIKSNTINDDDINFFNEQIKKLTNTVGSDNTLKSFALDLMPILNLKAGDSIEQIRPAIEKVSQSVNALIALHSVEEYQKDIEIADENVRRSVESFLRLKVQPEYRSRVNAKVNEWLRALKLGINAEKPYNEVLAMTERYHMFKTPVKVLDEYLLSFTKSDELSQIVRQAYEKTIEGLLNNAKFVKMQSLLMDATEKGLTNKVAREFDNVDLTWYSYDKDGNEIGTIIKKMSSPDTLLTMVKSLVIEDEYEIAKAFIEKFNLEKTVVPLLINSSEVTLAKEALKTMQETRDTFVEEEKLIKYVRNKIDSLQQLDSEGLIATAYEIIDYLGKQSYNKENNYYIDNIIATLENFISNAEVDKLAKLETKAMFHDMLDAVLAKSLQNAINEIKEINNFFFNASMIHDLLESLNLTNYPELQKDFENFSNEISDMLAIQNSLMAEINNVKILPE